MDFTWTHQILTLRFLVCSLAVLGVIGHASGLIGYFFMHKTYLFGLDFVSPVAKLAMTKIFTLREQLQYELYLKSFVDGSGILASSLLFIGAWKRHHTPCFIYIIYAFLYLFGMGLYGALILKMGFLGFKASDMKYLIIPASITTTLLLLNLCNTTALIIQVCRSTREWALTGSSYP